MSERQAAKNALKPMNFKPISNPLVYVGVRKAGPQG